MAGMRKEYDPNKAGRRKRRPIIYIICEGKETEIKYFKHFRSRNCLVDIVPISSKHKAAEHLVKHAKGLLSQSDYFPKDGDQLWCVFDCGYSFMYNRVHEVLTENGSYSTQKGTIELITGEA